jgi:acid phosphatase family membrane protein YuiD
MPSNHSAIVSSIAMMIALREGIDSPAFGVAMALAFIVMLDANSLRQKIGQQARLLNQVSANLNLTNKPLRERIGHSKFEILAGIVSGCVSAYLLLILIG